MLTKITRQHHTDRRRLRCVPGLHEFVLQLLKFSFEPLMGLHQVTRYLWHATTSVTSTTLKHHYHHHMKSCIFSNFPLSLHWVMKYLWHTHIWHINISNTETSSSSWNSASSQTFHWASNMLRDVCDSHHSTSTPTSATLSSITIILWTERPAKYLHWPGLLQEWKCGSYFQWYER